VVKQRRRVLQSTLGWGERDECEFDVDTAQAIRKMNVKRVKNSVATSQVASGITMVGGVGVPTCPLGASMM
jgi:hypothetical protein